MSHDNAARSPNARSRERRTIVPGAYCSDRAYADDEAEFLRAIQEYQARTGRKFPSWTEALALLKTLGYRKP